MAFYYISLGRSNLSSLLLTFLLWLSAGKIVAQNNSAEVANVTINNKTESSFTVTWTPPNVTVTKYRVMISNTTNTVDTDTTATTYTASSLLPGVTYTTTIYTIYVLNNGTNSSSSGVTQNTTTLPSSVSNFQVTANGTNEITLGWTTPSDVNAATYNYSIIIQPGDRIISSNTNAKSVTVTGLSPGNTYTFTINTVTQNGVKSSKSQALTITTKPSPITGLLVSSISNSSMTLSWTLSSDSNASSYTYTVSYDGGNVKVTGTNTTKITNLTAGKTYNFMVYAVTWNGISSDASSVSATTRPPDVTNVIVADMKENSFTVSWMAPSGVTNINYRVIISHTTTNVINQTTTDPTYKASDLLPGVTYVITIYVVDSNGGSSSGVTQTATTLPSNVSGFRVTALGTNEMMLGWNIPSDVNAATYKYSIMTQPGNKNTSSNINANSVNVTELSPGKDYTFTIRTVTQNGVQSTGQVLTSTTMPSSVSNFHVTAKGTNQITFGWTIPSDDNAATYKYSIMTQPGNMNTSSNINANSVNVTGLSPGNDYSFTIYAVTQNGVQSTGQALTSTTLPSGVSNFHVTAKGTNEITFGWTIPSDDNAAAYKYSIMTQPGNMNASSNTNANSVNVTGLSPGSDYSFTIYTVTKNGVQSTGQVLTSTTRPNAPINLQGNAVSVSEIDISWMPPGDVNDKSYDYVVTYQDTNVSPSNTISTTNDTKLNINSLLPGHLYKITVTSMIKNTSSGTYTEIYTATFSESLTEGSLSAGKVNNTSITLTWSIPNNPTSVVSGYRVTVYQNGTMTSQDETAAKEYVVDKLLPGSVYNLSVESFARYPKPGVVKRAATIDNSITSYSTPSTIVIETVPDPVNTLWCTKVDAYQIKVHFQCPKGSYSIFTVLVNSGYGKNVSSCTEEVYISNLSPASSYQISVRTVATDKSITTDAIICSTDSTGVIVGSIFGILLFLLLIAVIAFFVLKKRRSKGGNDNILTTPKTRRFHTIPKEKFKQHYENNHTNSDFGFADEYQELSSVGTMQSKRAAELPENRGKNRFTNVLPYDHSRVKLSTVNGISNSDYINANYMPGYNSSKEFIASQGPLPNTTADFWRMVWEHQVNTIVMLTNCMENGRVKCEHYWPLDYTPCTYGDLTVTVTSETILSEWTIRDFSVKHAHQPGIKYVRHFHFTAWPDHGVPDSTSSITKFRNLVREHMDERKNSGPTVVHCSAGVGRTGTLIALDYLIQQMQHEQRLGVYGFVEKMRMNRNLMVQTEAQYIFLNKCMLDLITPPPDEHIYENHTGNELVYENISAIRNLQQENV